MGLKARLRGMGMNRQVVVLSAARMADAYCNSMLIVLLPLYVVETPRYGIFARMPDEMLIGILISMSGLMFALMQPLAAWVSDRLGRRKPFILGGLIVLAVATLGYIPANSFSQLAALRLVQGFGIAFTIPTALALLSAYADAGRVGTAMGVFTTARMIGFAIGPLVGGLVMTTVSFQAAFMAGAAGALVSLLFVLLYVPEVRGDDVHAPRPGARSREREEHTETVSPERRRAVMRQVYIMGSGIYFMAVSISLIAAVEPELNRRLDQTALGFGVAFAMLTVGRFLTQIPIGHISDHIGRRPLIRIGMFVMIPLAVLQGFAPTTLSLSAVRFLLGVASALVVAPAYALVSDLALPGRMVRQMSVLTMAFGLGVATGPMISGLLAGVAGFEVPFIAAGVALTFGAIFVAAFVKESLPGRVEVLHHRTG